jgi:hypothetical protein
MSMAPEMTFDFGSLWNFDDPAASEQRFCAALTTETDEAVRLELETQVARAQGLQGRIGDGHATLDALEELATGRAMVRLLLERGRLINTSGCTCSVLSRRSPSARHGT